MLMDVRLKLLHIALSDGGPLIKNEDLLEKLNSRAPDERSTISTATLSRYLNPQPKHGAKSSTHDAINFCIDAFLNSDDGRSICLENYIDQLPSYQGRRPRIASTIQRDSVPVECSGLWLGIHYATRSRVASILEPKDNIYRTFILSYGKGGRSRKKIGYEIYGFGTKFDGQVEFLNNTLYYFGWETQLQLEGACIIMSQIRRRGNEHFGIMSGVSWDDINGKSHLFSTKLMMKSIIPPEGHDDFIYRIATDETTRKKWCNYFSKNGEDGTIELNHANESIKYVVKAFIGKSSAETGVNLGNRLFID